MKRPISETSPEGQFCRYSHEARILARGPLILDLLLRATDSIGDSRTVPVFLRVSFPALLPCDLCSGFSLSAVMIIEISPATAETNAMSSAATPDLLLRLTSPTMRNPVGCFPIVNGRHIPRRTSGGSRLE